MKIIGDKSSALDNKVFQIQKSLEDAPVKHQILQY